ncbi:MAG: dihydropteroate synthase [Phycisphaerae bacterium]|nr:dihydropteroate synthase [Phycisphaerae bacterium]
MDISNFTTIAENIHCTLIVKLDGKKVVDADGQKAVKFTHEGRDRLLPISPAWKSPMLEQGKVQHVALALWHAMNSSGEDKQAGEDYLVMSARKQIDGGATFLDVNVDEYSNDNAVRVDVMKFLATFLSERFDTPLSIDSSNKAVLRAGLECCRKDLGEPMLNSVSLEREDCIELVPEFNAHVVVSAAGKEGLPTTLEGRMTNLREIIGRLDALGVDRSRMHLDPLVFPISTDPMNGKGFFEVTTAAKKEFGEVKITGGYSNISFGMPNRKLLNEVFIYLVVEAGAESGIINPVATPIKAVAALDANSEPFQLAKAVLEGTDMYGMEYISAFREGRLG